MVEVLVLVLGSCGYAIHNGVILADLATSVNPNDRQFMTVLLLSKPHHYSLSIVQFLL